MAKTPLLSTNKESAVKLTGISLLGINQLERADIEQILATASAFEEVSTREIKKVPALRGKTVVNLFYEPSTRTRTSFELAAKRLSADVINIATASSAVAKGESLKDTAKTMEAMGVDAIVIRHSCSGAPLMLSRWIEASIINAGDGAHEHPTQALLDLYTIRKHKEIIDGLNIIIVGDIYHSRVARSNIQAMVKMGASVTVVAPPTLIPPEIESLGARVAYELDPLLPEADVVYMLRMQLERQQQQFFPTIREYSERYCLTPQRHARLKTDALIMHPGPMNRGVEISSEVADLAEEVITEQVTGGIAVRMAVLYLVLGGAELGQTPA